MFQTSILYLLLKRKGFHDLWITVFKCYIQSIPKSIQVFLITLVGITTGLKVVYWRTRVCLYVWFCLFVCFVLWCNRWTCILSILLCNDLIIIYFHLYFQLQKIKENAHFRKILEASFLIHPLTSLIATQCSPKRLSSLYTANLGSTHKIWMLIRYFLYSLQQFPWAVKGTVCALSQTEKHQKVLKLQFNILSFKKCNSSWSSIVINAVLRSFI